MKSKTIKVDFLARVEGEGGLFIKIRNGVVADLKLNIFEPPRFFEAFLRGRAYHEAPDITARICGICPVAYQMCAVHAMEQAFAVQITEPIRLLRRLLYCGEWIESHALHIYLLHAPDFMGYQDAVQMAADHPDAVKRGLELKKIGNELMIVIGGREIHPINVRVGGFYRMPEKSELSAMVEKLKWAREASLETVRLVAGLNFPDFEQDYSFVSLRHDTDYPLCEGRLVSNRGLDIPMHEWNRHFDEDHVAHSNALHAHYGDSGSYLVGPMARYALNFDHLTPLAQGAATDAGLGPVCRNPFKSIIVRSVELVYACEEALRIIELYEKPAQPAVEVAPKAASGYAITEAPRGSLYHRYRLDASGIIHDSRIVPPTSQNLARIEEDLRAFVKDRVDMSQEDLTWQCEQAVRNYDPCISCATHFLKVTLDRQ